MTPESFVYWLCGVLETDSKKTLDAKQVKCIRQHLAMVLKSESKKISKSEMEKLFSGQKFTFPSTASTTLIC